MATWAAEEFAGAELGDGRLARRLIKLAATFADKPTTSIPGPTESALNNAQHYVYKYKFSIYCRLNLPKMR